MGIEPILYCLEGSGFIQLSYPRNENKYAGYLIKVKHFTSLNDK